MPIFIKLAWRNIFRNKRRTIIAGTAIALGLAALIFFDALMIGLKENMIKTATSSFLGEGQIHRQGFTETQEVEKTINNLPEVVASLKNEEIVQHFTLRTMSLGMISSPANIRGINLVGIEPSTEKEISKIDEAIVKGDYFDGDNKRDIIIGSKLAKLLNVGLGDRVVVTVSQAHTGDLSQELFRVSGIFTMADKEMNSGMVFIRLDQAQKMLGLAENQVHEIALQFTSIEYSSQKNLPFWKRYSKYGNEAKGWVEILPQLEYVLELTDFSMLILGIILFSVVVFSIVNTLFMSIYERMFEFGVLRAIGTRPFKMFQLIFYEAGALAILSVILGIILGVIAVGISQETGIDYRGIEFTGVTFHELVYPVFQVKQFIIYPIVVFLITILVGIYPAVHAARIKPVKALRRSL